jgi:hypothetical protein
MKIFIEWVFHCCGSVVLGLAWRKYPNSGENDDASLRGNFTRVISVNIDDNVSVPILYIEEKFSRVLI